MNEVKAPNVFRPTKQSDMRRTRGNSNLSNSGTRAIHPMDPGYANRPTQIRENINGNKSHYMKPYKNEDDLRIYLKDQVRKQKEDRTLIRMQILEKINKIHESTKDPEAVKDIISDLQKKYDSLGKDSVWAYKHVVMATYADVANADIPGESQNVKISDVVEVKTFDSSKTIKQLNKEVVPELCRLWKQLIEGQGRPMVAHEWVELNE